MCVHVNEHVVQTHVSQHLCVWVFVCVEENNRERVNKRESVTDPERSV